MSGGHAYRHHHRIDWTPRPPAPRSSDTSISRRGPNASSGGNLPASNGLTTAEMSNPASFVGWDFGQEGVWVMPTGATHPVVRWQVVH
jgi:hypothetical protein